MKIVRLIHAIIGISFLFSHSWAGVRTVHVVVSLCDNKNQGIVPVPAAIGNGRDPANNLYWGCGYGVKTFLKIQSDWKLLKQAANPSEHILERLIFKHRDSLVYIIADAYDGASIKKATADFLNYCAGRLKNTIVADSVRIETGGGADLLCYVGHNGLMDFSLLHYPSIDDTNHRDAIILACASKNYFAEPISKTGANPLLWTTNLMSPEAYTLVAAIDSWLKNEKPATLVDKAARTYSRYQKCSLMGAKMLFSTGY